MFVFPGSVAVVLALGIGALVGGIAVRSLPQLSERGKYPSSPQPFLFTNETYVEDVRSFTLNLQDVRAVFAYVFSKLPNTVRVYPTENYYYFRFFSGGQEIWGNIRLDVEEREKGLVSFAYFRIADDPNPSDPISAHKNLGPADGAVLKKTDPLRYTLTYRGKTVTLLLNDLPQTPPDGLELREGEEFLSRTFDESGFQLVLLFDTKKPGFRFVLDPTAPLPDVLEERGAGLRLGLRTGFAFYEDEARHRKVLMGVKSENISRNNYYDGPFDQLADNFVSGTRFEEYAERVYTTNISQRGFFLNEKGEKEGNRLALQPYLAYTSLEQLNWFVWFCQQPAQHDILACLTKDPNTDKAEEKEPRAENRTPPVPTPT